MHERGNGLGGGFAAYGIYPEHPDRYAFHVMYDHKRGKQDTERVLYSRCDVAHDEPIPTRPLDAIKYRPILHRYFLNVKDEVLERDYDKTEEDVVVELVMDINRGIDGGFIFSSGRNMGSFKGLGYPEEIGDFFRLDEYKAYVWTAHGRFPTNTTGWWGGAHPFGLLDWSVVHNGEISSYGINRRYLANFGYHCSFHTDTEVITYMFDLLVRKHNLPVEVACLALAPPLWSRLKGEGGMGEKYVELATAIRQVYGGALLNGPFSILVGHSGGMIALNDRIKLRPLVEARKGDMFYVASEEAAIRKICKEPDFIRHPDGGEPVIGRLKRA
jgi:glutamate synthase domain-containing protein 1